MTERFCPAYGPGSSVCSPAVCDCFIAEFPDDMEQAGMPHPEFYTTDFLSCAYCGLTPPDGVASISKGETTRYYCHPDVGQDCYSLAIRAEHLNRMKGEMK